MKIFDYKFLILLGLSLVVYFIYREVEYLRTKVDKLEKEFKSKSDNLLTDKTNIPNTLEYTNTNTNRPVLALPLPPVNSKQSELETVIVPETIYNLNIINDNVLGRTSPKRISVDMSPSKADEQTNFESGVKLTTIVNKQKVHSESESSSDTSSSKHLAIYSNDNEQYDETQNSLLESIESNKMELNFDYNNKLQMENIETNVNELINMVTTQDESEKLKSESKSDDENKSESKNVDEISFSTDIKSSSSDKLNESELEKKKLPEIKKIAESNKISLTKKVNGQQKPKNKQELINEIIGKNI
jgi:hypothetical protein